MTNKALYCAYWWLTKTVLSRLQIKIHPKGLQNFAFYILTFDFSFTILTPRPSSLTPNPSPLAPNFIVRKHLRLYNCRDSFTDVMSALQIAPILTNKANFLDDQMNVTSFITTNYEQRTMNYEIKTNPIQSQFKPNTNPIQSQNKANSNPNKPNPPTLTMVNHLLRRVKILFKSRVAFSKHIAILMTNGKPPRRATLQTLTDGFQSLIVHSGGLIDLPIHEKKITGEIS
jgi:hypothetical protein